LSVKVSLTREDQEVGEKWPSFWDPVGRWMAVGSSSAREDEKRWRYS
jgi:hypothetical protein